MEQFFARDFYPVSLFYLGMLTIKDQYTMMLPNQTMREIFTEYFNTLAHIEVSEGYTPYFRQFLIDLDLDKLFAGYWEVYVGQLPAQLFDKMNENFFRTTFFELCSRYLSRDFTFGVEVNHPSGRSDWEMLGKPDSPYANTKFLLEFKYTPMKDEHKSNLLQLNAPLPGRCGASHALCGRYPSRIPAIHHPPLYRLHCRAERVSYVQPGVRADDSRAEGI